MGVRDIIAVGLAEIRVVKGTDHVLVAYSLGSCVGVALWDPEVLAAGMAHIVLPSSTGAMVSSIDRGSTTGRLPRLPGKFADTGVPHLVQLMLREGAQRERMRAWIAGGAHVLRDLEWPGGDIGSANVKAVLEALGQCGISPPRRDVGEDYGRTMKLYAIEGRATVTSVGRAERDI